MKRSDLLPPPEHYTRGTHPGTSVWRHARTALTPDWPRWIYEGSRCAVSDDSDPEPCPGRRVPYKLGPEDHGLVTVEDFNESSTAPAPDVHAGDWICDTCAAEGVISLAEVQQHADDVPAALRGDNVLPLFGRRELEATDG